MNPDGESERIEMYLKTMQILLTREFALLSNIEMLDRAKDYYLFC